MNSLDVALVRDAAHDPEVGIELAAVNGKINIHGVVVGRQQHGSRAADASPFDRLPVGGVARIDRINVRREGLERLLVTIERIDDQRLLFQRPCGGLPDLACANHQHRRRRAFARDQRVERANLRGRTRDDRYGISANFRMREGGSQPATLPQPNDAQTGQLAQARIAHERTRKERVADRQLGDMHVVE